MEYTKTLTDYAVDLKYEELPKAVTEQAKLLTLQTVGVALASYPTDQAKTAIALAKAMGGEKKESTIVGDGTKVPSACAGFANGTMADILDWEDCSWTGHPSAGAVPAALAVAEAIKASGKEYITSVVAGYEVYQRIAMAVQPSEKQSTFVKGHGLTRGHGLTSWQIFASAIPAAKLLKLSKDKMAQAIGIAGALTPIVNPKVHLSRTNFYHYQHGCTCRDGIVAACIAKNDADALLDDMLDGDNGYWSAVSDQCQWGWYTKGLGKDYLIMETLFKHWPTNKWIQPILDAVDALTKEHQIAPDDISSITEIVVSPNLDFRMIHRPEGYRGIVDAEFSIPYCIAVMLLDPQPGPNWYTAEGLRDPRLLQLASKVKATGPTAGGEGLDKLSLRTFPEMTVTIVFRDGKQFTKSIDLPKGHPQNRLTYDEYKDRFRLAASFALKPEKIEMAIEKIFKLEEVDDMSEISELLHD